MTTITHPLRRFSVRHHHPLTTAALLIPFWLAAAVLVVTMHVQVEPRSARAGAVAEILALLVVAYAYTRFAAREAGGADALVAGTIWLALSIAVELAVTAGLGYGWFTLFGSPERPLLRQMLLFAWIFAPVLFSRRRAG